MTKYFTLSYFIGEWQIFALLPGSGLLAGAAIYSAHIREFEINKCRFGALMALIWGAIALFFGSSAVGFLSVGALMMSMGFIIEKTPLCTYFGFKDDSLIGPAAAQSTLLVVGYTAIKVAGFASALSVFEPGVFWLASFVSMLSMLILSSKWYPAESGTTVLMNFGALALYFGAIAVGNYYSIGALATMGTTFFIFFASEKILEIPASSAIGFGAKLVTVGGFLMWVWHLMHTEPILQRLMAG